MVSNSKHVVDANVENGLRETSKFGHGPPSTSKCVIDIDDTDDEFGLKRGIKKKKIKPSVLSSTQVIELVDTPEKASTSAFYSFAGIQENDSDESSSSVSVSDGYVGDDGDKKPAARTQCE